MKERKNPLSFPNHVYAFGNRIKDIMTEKKITGGKLSKRTGKNKHNISDIINGKTNTSLDMVLVLLKGLKCTSIKFSNITIIWDTEE